MTFLHLLVIVLLASTVYTSHEQHTSPVQLSTPKKELRWGRTRFHMKMRVATDNPRCPTKLKFKLIERGTPGTDSHRLFYETQHGIISPLHDIPLFASMQDKVFNMIVEVPSMQDEKWELSLGEYLNPLRRQDCHLHNLYMWNYGSFPNTYENPDESDYFTGKGGDGAPIDVIDIGEKQMKRGQVVRVKVLGVLGLISKQKIDWKIIAININDTNAARLNDADDVHKHFPGYLNSTVEWFQHYNVPDGRALNRIALKGQVRGSKFAWKVIEKAMQKWILMAMARVKHPAVCMVNTISGKDESEFKIPFEEAKRVLYNGAIPSVLLTTTPPSTTDTTHLQTVP
uniref:inorganic diphosphatase n=3 Tax=Cacopsylla melanoneura TaxID=428564 RepID=A0A8D8VNJ2_9HEMI